MSGDQRVIADEALHRHLRSRIRMKFFCLNNSAQQAYKEMQENHNDELPEWPMFS